jgi:hypothetical protein
MPQENCEALVKTRILIEHTRNEVERLRREIEMARETVDRSRKLLAGTEPESVPE